MWQPYFLGIVRNQVSLGYPNRNPHIRTYRGILCMYLWYYRGKFGGCRQIPTQKNVSGSKLCRRDRGILAKCADIWLSGRHVTDISATFSAKRPHGFPSPEGFPFLIFTVPIFLLNIIFPTFSNVATRVWRSPVSWGQADCPKLPLVLANTTKSSTRVTRLS